ncbi:EI24 domain-containing protein [Agrococcus sp. SGAir0287]|uniref:EI24 domain-containing protein n=1 Tax=Agrococcus sp. SGAir0287 TaxID=2070347 RepID=UPI001586C3D7|nr:EI24 domain-containing protein [Agrococcus sp. SGAir0287]
MRRIRSLLHGMSILAAGLRLSWRNPRLAILGMVPPIVVGVAFVVGLVVLGLNALSLATALTPFADGWADPWPDVTRVVLAIAIVAGAGVLGVLLFAAVTLLVGAPFYERIWRRAEDELGGIRDEVELSIGQSIAKGIDDGLRLAGVAILTGLVVVLLGLIPGVGTILGWVGGALVGSRALAVELSGMPADARGLSLDERRRLLDAAPDVARGFGLAVYLLFLVPGGAVLCTPAATVGGMLLVRELRGEPTGPLARDRAVADEAPPPPPLA